MTESVFAGRENGLFQTYQVELRFTGRLAGSIPSEPVDVTEMVMRQWSQATGKPKKEITREELHRRVTTYLEELGKDITQYTPEDIEKLAQETTAGSTNVFRREPDGKLWFPSHAIKQSVKEAVNILYAGERWGATKKGPMNFVAERSFIDPDRVPIVRNGQQLSEPDGVQVLHGRVQGPQGPRSIVTQHEWVDQPTLSFTLRALVPQGIESDKQRASELQDRWPAIFRFMESNGIGSHRRMSEYGRFVTIRFELEH